MSHMMPRPETQLDTEDKDEADKDAYGDKVNPVGDHY